MHQEKNEPIKLNVDAVLKNNVSDAAYGAAIDIIRLVWWPTKTPFEYNEAALASHFSKQHPARCYTEEKLRKYKNEIGSFFTVLKDGRWAPSPEYLSTKTRSKELS